MTIDKQKLQKLLWSEVASWKADCADWKRNAEALQEFLGEKTLEEVALELLAENATLRDVANFRAIQSLRQDCEALRTALSECSGSLEGEMLQKYAGQSPEDMHPVTRRDYDRDMAEVAGYRAAMGKGEQS